MEVHFPGLTVSRHRAAGGRHTSLIGGTDDSGPGGYPADDPGRYGQGTRVTIRGDTGHQPWPDGPGASEPGETGYLTGPGSRASSDYRPGSGSSEPGRAGYRPGSGYRPGGYESDTVVIGDLGLFSSRRPADWPKVGVSREPPRRPWFQNRARLAIAATGLAAVGIGGFVGVPALLQALGVDTGSQSGSCPVCQFPIPSSAAVPPDSGSAPASSATSPARASTRTRAVPASPPAPAAVVRQPQSTPAGQTISPLSVTYSATPGSGGQFTGQVTVVNRGAAPITNWQMVVALPHDTVSAVQNAEISDQNDVLFLSPAPEDLSVPPGGTVVVSIFASGPTATPAACSFNNVPCQ
jgi:hypothetical protein